MMGFLLRGMGLISRYGVLCVAQVGMGCSMGAGNASAGKWEWVAAWLLVMPQQVSWWLSLCLSSSPLFFY